MIKTISIILLLIVSSNAIAERAKINIDKVFYANNRIILFSNKKITVEKESLKIDLYCLNKNGSYDSLTKIDFKLEGEFLYTTSTIKKTLSDKKDVIFDKNGQGYYKFCNVFADESEINTSFDEIEGRMNNPLKFSNLIVKEDYMLLDFNLDSSSIYLNEYIVFHIKCINNKNSVDFINSSALLVKFIKIEGDNKIIGISEREDALIENSNFRCKTEKLFVMR